MGTETKKVLVIDDEKNMCHMLQTILEKSGFSVDTALDGEKGLQKIKSNDYNFILCDLKMPKTDGIEVLKSIQNQLDNTSVIMMSAYGTIDTAIEAIKLGSFDIISKPLKHDEILIVL